MPRLYPIHITPLTLEYGVECSVCLLWYVPIREEDPCVQCAGGYKPKYPNRVKYLSVKNRLSQVELSKVTGISNVQIHCIQAGKVVPTPRHQAKIVRAFGLSASRDNIRYVFPNLRPKGIWRNRRARS